MFFPYKKGFPSARLFVITNEYGKDLKETWHGEILLKVFLVTGISKNYPIHSCKIILCAKCENPHIYSFNYLNLKNLTPFVSPEDRLQISHKSKLKVIRF
jgi:hypothetical protein